MTTAKVYEAIVQVQAALAKDGISKNQRNQSQNYAFRGIDDIYNALANHLAQAKLCILPRLQSRVVSERTTVKWDAQAKREKESVLFYVAVEVEFDFVSAEDGTKHIVRMAGEAMDSGDKATNKAMSAAYKYACLQTFCIPTEADNDADAHTHTVAPKQKPNASSEFKPAPKVYAKSHTEERLEKAKEILFPNVNERTGEIVDDNLPDVFDEISTATMQGWIDACLWKNIGEHRIQTKCSLKGKRIKDVIKVHEEVIKKNFDELELVDQMAFDSYAVFLEEQTAK